jgi:superfamily I DNA and/or RNA helicase
MEIADKDGLAQAINEGVVFKTNLTSDESKKLPRLKSVEIFTPVNGELLLSTYYKLSQKQKEIANDTKRFDFLIIEEASQAYLATIAMFSCIANKVLIIGDHKQLTPVVIKKEEAKKIDNNIDGIINGLQTVSLNEYKYSYRLINTRRLTSDAAKLTGLYYNSSLLSISKIEGVTKFNSKFFDLFHSNGGISIAKLPSSMTGFTEKDLVEFMCTMAIDILKGNKEFEMALLTPYINIESKLYERFSKVFSDYSRITINTIHKIQGLTSDVSILFLPLSNPNFDLDANLFNVATSRAKRGTLIITYKHVELITGASSQTLSFIHHCKDVTRHFIEHLESTFE